ncbi:helix-turn-helix transcriptional regulator [Tomitella gaofuii]|uniref:helix-turn-helix transcriptional regulator n=1 Tax=Tomitella gaofuii TaxID=2760083 RepID=UPI0015F9DF55|nr:LuxR family transcriptional regulator [Tomitella gaofuii]
MEDFSAALRRAVTEGPGSSSESRTFVVTGAPGIGKTFTLDSVLTPVIAEAAGVHVLRGTADELAHRYPYEVLARTLGKPLGEPVPPDADEILLARVDALCAARPVVLALDDVHHCDAATLALLNVFAAASRALPLTLVVAHRTLPAREQLRRLARYPDAYELALQPLSPEDVAQIARSALGTAPGPGLRAMLDGACGHPMHVLAMLEQLALDDALVEAGGVTDVRAGMPTPAAPALGEIIESQLTHLTGATRDVVQRLAVWGAPTALSELAALADESPVSMVEPVQAAVETGMIRFGADDRLHFRHDLYAETVYRRIPEVLRAVLHEACAARLERIGAPATTISHHLVAAGAGPQRLARVLEAAGGELAAMPSVAADLLESVTVAMPENVESLTLARARALAGSGQLRKAGDLARGALQSTEDDEIAVALRGLIIFTALTLGDVQETLTEIEATLRRPLPPSAAGRLADLADWARALAGLPDAGPVASSTTTAEHVSSTRVLATAIRLMTAGRPVAALEWALLAAGEPQAGGMHWNAGGTAEVWPPIIELHARGPLPAADLLATGSPDGGRRWSDPYSQFAAAGVDLAAGRLADAAAQFESALELSDRMELGWTSLAFSSLAMIDVHRGDHAAAEARLDRFTAMGQPDLFGFPEAGRVRVALLEARRQRKAAARLAAALWDEAVADGRLLWLSLVAAEFIRVAAARGDRLLVDRIVRGLAALPRPLAPVTDALVRLAQAGADTDPADALSHAVAAAARFRALGMPLEEAGAWEEAACRAAEGGDLRGARAHARAAQALFDGAGAPTSVARVATRLRARGMRIGSHPARRKPTSGWESLTITETRVTALVGQGLTGPQIADRLGISPRTVQTHVSHVLTKLGLRTRIELAVAFANRPG